MGQVRVPLDIICFIVDLLVLDTPELSYDYIPSVKSTLVALSLTSHDVNHCARRLLYSKLSLSSTNALQLFMQTTSRANLKTVQSLYVNIDSLQTTYKRAYYKDVTACLLALLKETSPSLKRLAILCSFWRAQPERRLGLEHERYLWHNVQSVFPSVLGNLTELVILNGALFLNFLPAIYHAPIADLTHLALSASEDTRQFARREAWTLMPNLESVRVICQEDTITDVERIVNHLPDSCVLDVVYQSSRYIGAHLVGNLSSRLRRAQNRPKPIEVKVMMEPWPTCGLTTGYF